MEHRAYSTSDWQSHWSLILSEFITALGAEHNDGADNVSNAHTWALYNPRNVQHVVFARDDAYPFRGVRLELIELAHQATQDSGRDRLQQTIKHRPQQAKSATHHVSQYNACEERTGERRMEDGCGCCSSACSEMNCEAKAGPDPSPPGSQA